MGKSYKRNSEDFPNTARAKFHGRRIARENKELPAVDTLGSIARHEGCFSVIETDQFVSDLEDSYFLTLSGEAGHP